jgi:hypothetical protein
MRPGVGYHLVTVHRQRPPLGWPDGYRWTEGERSPTGSTGSHYALTAA